MGHLDGIRRAWQIGSDTGYSWGPWWETHRCSRKGALKHYWRICIQQFHATICFFYYTTHLCLKIGLLFCRWTTGKSGQNKPRQKMYISWIQCCCEKNQTWTYEQSIPWWSTCSLRRASGVMSREMNTNGCSSRGPHRRCFNICYIRTAKE